MELKPKGGQGGINRRGKRSEQGACLAIRREETEKTGGRRSEVCGLNGEVTGVLGPEGRRTGAETRCP